MEATVSRANHKNGPCYHRYEIESGRIYQCIQSLALGYIRGMWSPKLGQPVNASEW